MVDELVRQLLPYIVSGVGIAIVTIVISFRRLSNQYDGFVGDCRKQVADLSVQVRALSQKLSDQADNHAKDWRTWFEERNRLQSEIDRLQRLLDEETRNHREERQRWSKEKDKMQQEIDSLRLELDRLIEQGDERELVIQEQRTLIEKLRNKQGETDA